MTIEEIIGNTNDTNIEDISIGDDESLPPEKEIAEYLISFRANDLIESRETKRINIDINEVDFLKELLYEQKEEFRVILRNAVALAYANVFHNYDQANLIAKEIKKIRNRIDIELIIDIDTDMDELRSENYEGEVVTFEANVANWSETRGVSKHISLKCPDCGDIQTWEYKENLVKSCIQCHVHYEEYFSVETEATRRITLKEIISDLVSKSMPMSITADFFGSELARISLSDNVIATGIFRSLPLRKEKGKLSREFIPTIQIISVRRIEDDKGKLPDPEQLKKFEDLEKDGQLMEKLIDSYAYNVYKKRMEKKAILCSLAGSVQIGEKGSGIPPMIHVLFVGDAGTYKSTLMKYITKVFRKAVRVDSKTVSNAGLKAITVKMPDGNMAIRAGLLPMYNDGVIFIDEFGVLDSSLYDDLRNPMIDGTVSKNMGGEHYNASARTGILGSMNPVDNIWDFAKGIHDNLIPPLDVPLITRFDLIIVFSTKSPDYNKDEIKKHFARCDINGKDDDMLTDMELTLFFNQIRLLKPVITPVILEYIGDFFSEIDDRRKENGQEEVNIRTENAVKKLTVAIAKLHMTEKITIEHTKEAIELYKHSILTFGMDIEKGEILAESTIKKSEDGRRIALKMAYDNIKDTDGYCFEVELVERVLYYNVFSNINQVKALINKMQLEGKITTKNSMITINWNA